MLRVMDSVVVVVFWLGLPSVATTVIAFTPVFNVSVRLHVAMPAPLAVSRLARTPLTVTDEIPLSPRAASVAVPEIVIDGENTVWPRSDL